jgi:hypothetical protein
MVPQATGRGVEHAKLTDARRSGALRLTRASSATWLREGTGPPVTRIGGKMLVVEDGPDRWIAEQQRKGGEAGRSESEPF